MRIKVLSLTLICRSFRITVPHSAHHAFKLLKTVSVTGSHRVFEDLYAFFACTSAECVFCRVKHPATEGHLQRKHLKEAMFFIHQGKGTTQSLLGSYVWTENEFLFYFFFTEKFVVACLCSDSASQSRRSHYHCPFCRYRPFKRDLNFKYHLQKMHGKTVCILNCQQLQSVIYPLCDFLLCVCRDYCWKEERYDGFICMYNARTERATWTVKN